MGKTADAAATTRRKIIATAAAEFKARGFNNVGVADLMAQLGLTHGGFYRHFQSKDQLIVEACQEAFNIMNAEKAKDGHQHSPEGLRSFLTEYLHSNCPETLGATCAFATIGSDLARSDDVTRAVATEA